jgi:hypothetical protein
MMIAVVSGFWPSLARDQRQVQFFGAARLNGQHHCGNACGHQELQSSGLRGLDLSIELPGNTMRLRSGARRLCGDLRISVSELHTVPAAISAARRRKLNHRN